MTPIPCSTLSNSTGSTENSSDIFAAAKTIGLKPTHAWVLDENNKCSLAAARAKRCREKAESHGLSQISITTPTALHPMLKLLAARTKAGEPAETVLAELAAEQNCNATHKFLHELPLWRRLFLRLFLPRELRNTLFR